ncbi:MAG: hypothetical protein AAB839_00130 [Patescibacteria group bacterium]
MFGDARRSLETKRFTPTTESLGFMKDLREGLLEIQRVHPEVQGLAFFGSRTTGLERNDPGNPSDMDVVLFYDGSRFISHEKNLDLVGGRLTVNPRYQPERTRLAKERETLIDHAKHILSQRMTGLGLSIDLEAETGRNKTISVVDISPTVTDSVLARFEREVDRDTNFGKQPLKLDQVGPEDYDLLSRFYLSVGEGVYQNRAYILDRLEQMGANGERYFQAIMAYLQYSERTKTTTKREGLTPFPHYPTTIAKAREYFLTK